MIWLSIKVTVSELVPLLFVLIKVFLIHKLDNLVAGSQMPSKSIFAYLRYHAGMFSRICTPRCFGN